MEEDTVLHFTNKVTDKKYWNILDILCDCWLPFKSTTISSLDIYFVVGDVTSRGFYIHVCPFFHTFKLFKTKRN